MIFQKNTSKEISYKLSEQNLIAENSVYLFLSY